FGAKADSFEGSINKLAELLGFDGQRPDEEWGEGPDNIWAIRDNEYLLIECKNEVETKRTEIHKKESGQMNNHIAWFRNKYGEVKVDCVMVINAKNVGKGAGFSEEVEVLREGGLKRFVANVESFYREFKDYDLKDISEQRVNEWLNQHHLSTQDVLKNYTEKTRYL
ncbi:MAG: hypothetical protein ACRD3B_14610, partial [Candidatus Sulfotelmatobacter sp.]